MTQIEFLGTGEAFDHNRTNTSYLILPGLSNKQGSLMVDSGYDAPKSLARRLESIGFSAPLAYAPDEILFTHEHGDHTAGFPALLMGIREDSKRQGVQRDLTVTVANPELINRLKASVEQDYAGAYDSFTADGLNIKYRVLRNQGEEVRGMNVRFAESLHASVNHAYRFETSEGKSFAISGDGSITDATKDLFMGVDLLIHEGFTLESVPGVSGHGEIHESVRNVINYASGHIPRVEIVHMSRYQRTREDEISVLKNYAKFKGVQLSFPEDQERLIL